MLPNNSQTLKPDTETANVTYADLNAALKEVSVLVDAKQHESLLPLDYHFLNILPGGYFVTAYWPFPEDMTPDEQDEALKKTIALLEEIRPLYAMFRRDRPQEPEIPLYKRVLCGDNWFGNIFYPFWRGMDCPCCSFFRGALVGGVIGGVLAAVGTYLGFM